MLLSDTTLGRGYIVVNNTISSISLKPGDRIKVIVKNEKVVVYRLIGTNERYVVPMKHAIKIRVRGAN